MELRQSVKYMKRYSGEDYSFVINRAKLDDRGEYIIRAENHYGAREEPVFLNVQRKYSSLILSCIFTHTGFFSPFSCVFLALCLCFFTVFILQGCYLPNCLFSSLFDNIMMQYILVFLSFTELFNGYSIG